MSATVAASNEVQLQWTPAEDPSGIGRYLIHENGQVVGTLPPDAEMFSVNHLLPAVEYVFAVQAEDSVGNVTDDGPMVTVILNDQTPPFFPRGERLNIVQTGVDSVSLPGQATDDVGVNIYEIYQTID